MITTIAGRCFWISACPRTCPGARQEDRADRRRHHGVTKSAEPAVIRWATGKENPCRPGTAKFERTEKLRKSHGLTVDQFLAKGGRRSTIERCVKAGLIRLTA
jgi:hypothetical protein